MEGRGSLGGPWLRADSLLLLAVVLSCDAAGAAATTAPKELEAPPMKYVCLVCSQKTPIQLGHSLILGGGGDGDGAAPPLPPPARPPPPP